MGLKLESITDPKLKSRIIAALEDAGELKRQIASINTETPKPAKRIRQSQKPLMNKLEEEYYNTYLYGCGSMVCIQSVRFKLGNGIWFKPDFFNLETLTGIEIKGPHAFRGGFENLKVAAHQYPYIKWVLVWKQDGDWKSQTVLP